MCLVASAVSLVLFSEFHTSVAWLDETRLPIIAVYTVVAPQTIQKTEYRTLGLKSLRVVRRSKRKRKMIAAKQYSVPHLVLKR